MSTRDHSPRLILVIGALAALGSCNVSTPTHAGDRPTVGPTESFVVIHSAPVAPAPKEERAPGLVPLTFDSPPLPPEIYLHPAYPEVRPTYTGQSYGGSTHTSGTITTPHGVVRFDSTSKH